MKTIREVLEEWGWPQDQHHVRALWDLLANGRKVYAHMEYALKVVHAKGHPIQTSKWSNPNA